MARSFARVDAGQVIAYAQKLEMTAQLADRIRDDWENDWGSKLADELRSRVPVDADDRSPGSMQYGHLRDNIQHVPAGGTAPGGVTFGNAFWWRFLEYGTSKMAPRPFIRQSIRKIRTPARKDAVERATRLIR